MKGNFKKFIAGVATLAMAAQFAFVIPASAAWTAPQYGADAAEIVEGTKMAVTDRSATIDGEEASFQSLGYVGGGINGVAAPADAGPATYKITADAAGDYDVTVTAVNLTNRRVDLQLGETVYEFPGSSEDEYTALWKTISDAGSSRPVSTYTFEDVALVQGENTVLVGTKDSTYAPDIVGLDVAPAAGGDAEPTDAPAEPTDAPEIKDGITYADGVVTVKTDDAAKAVLIYAQYSGTALKSASVYPLTFTEGIATQELKDAVNGSKLMVWTALDGDDPLMPVCGALTVENGVEPPVETTAPTTNPTSEPTEAPTPKPTIDPSLVYYTYDNENDVAIKKWERDATGKQTETSAWLTTPETWVSYYDDTAMSVQTDSNPAINKYFQFKNDSGKGPRSAYFVMPEAAATLDENQQSVIEFDFKLSTSNEYSELVIVGSDTPSAGTTVGNEAYKGEAYILKFYQDNALGGFYVNGNQTVLSKGYPGSGAWAHAKAVLNYESKSVLITVTSLDGATTYLETTQVAMGSSAGAPRIIFVGGGRNGGTTECIDNFMSRKVIDGDISGVYYSATFKVDGKETVLSAKEGEKVDASGIPATDKTGYIFDGWAKDGDTENLLTTETVADTPLTADVTYEAVYHKDPEYIEPMVDVQFSSFPTGGLPVMGEDADTYANNPIQVKLIGELGNDLLAEENKDSRVTDLDVQWEFDGFRTIVSDGGRDTSEAGENSYCDSYAQVVYDANDETKADFQLKKCAFNFYGQVKATVTYYGKTITISAPMSVLPTKTETPGQILPKPGFVSDFTPYADDMVGYKATISGDNKSATDIVTGDWAAYGGNSGRGLYIASEGEGDEAKKFLKLKSTGTNSSSFAVNKLDAAPTGQVIISQDVRFYNGGSTIMFKQDNPVTWSDNATTISLNFDGNSLTMNGGNKVADVTTGTWYHVVLSCDVTSKLWYAKVYDMEGTLLGESDAEAFVNAGSVAPTYLCYRTPDNANGELDFNNVKMYVPEIEGELTTTIDNDVLSIPGEDTPADAITSANLTVTALSTEKYEMIGKAEWSIENEPEHITITPDAVDSHKAVLKVEEGAQSGDINVVVSLGGKTKQIPVTLSASGDSVNFTEQVRSISIPITEGTPATAQYKAHVVDKDNAEITGGDNVTYAVYDKNNSNKLDTLPQGITFAVDEATHTATLSVDSTAAATVLYIRATGTNTDGETISRSVRVDIHGLAFDFGTATAAEGYTAVTPTTAYSDTAGYGIVSGTPTEDGEASAEDADSDALKGAFAFNAKVEKGKVYTVKINYSGTSVSEAMTKDMTGVSRSNATKGEAVYQIPVTDDVLDLSFIDATVSSIVIEKQADKQPGGKPSIYSVGDSTEHNHGSWGYQLNRDFSKYTELAAIVNPWNSCGQGSQNLGSYYNNGSLTDRVLINIKPGDYVTIGNMGTNGMGSDFEGSFNAYVDACLAMGAKVIINSYSPHGAVGSYANCYDAATHTFTGYRQDAYDVTVRKIYEERSTVGGEKYDPNVVGFVDIGKMADAAFNAYVADWENNTYGKKYASIDEAAAELSTGSFQDHNHYGNSGYSEMAGTLMLEGYKAVGDLPGADGIVKTVTNIIKADLAKNAE